MEWTDTATCELESTLDRLRASLNPQEVDADEVLADIRARIEEELSTGNGRVVTADNVRAALAKIGVGEMITAHAPVCEENRQFVQTMEKPRRIRNRISTGLFWFAGIILPLLALGTELLTHISLETGLPDPLPTPLHAVLIALVPLVNLLGWFAVHKNKSIPIKRIGFLLGAATTIASYYTLMFITVTPLAIMGFAAIIYYGIGLLCFLPLAPLLSLCTTLYMRALVKRKLLDVKGRIPLFRRGLLAGLAVIILASAPMYLTQLGLTLAGSDDPDVQLKGIRLLRTTGDKVLMNRACYWSAATPSDPVSWVIHRGERIRPEEARDIYYRVTGTAFNTVASPTLGIRNRRNPGDEFDWDPEQGGDVVAGRLKGLSLTDSRLDGLIDEDAATAYMEWTMVFRNDWRTEREARAQIALPPGAVVSRLTLWIDGEEREAAFGGRSQVKQAYKKVVRRRRDPVLVTTSGPDRVLMQCYPVPANGEMKIRIGVTSPLALMSETDRALRLPYMYERNFRISENTTHAVWLKGGQRLSTLSDTLQVMPDGSLCGDISNSDLNSTLGVVKGTSAVKLCWAEKDGERVSQQIQLKENHHPDHLALVIDGSAGMKPHRKEIAEALEALPRDIPVSVIFAGDETVELCRAQILENGRISRLQSQVQTLDMTGGQDNSDAIRQVWKIPYTGTSTAVIWIHGPQTWSLNSGEKLRQVLERQQHTELIDFQVEHGPHRLVEKLGDLSTFHAAPRFAETDADLKDLFRSLSNGQPVWEAKRSSIEEPPTESKRTSDHLVRLYAWDQIRADLTDGKPGNEEALRLALKHHLVTPVSGAVVLETQQQYKEAGLEPIDSNSAPNVPEPSVLALFIFAAMLMFFGRRMIHRVRLALEL